MNLLNYLTQLTEADKISEAKTLLLMLLEVERGAETKEHLIELTQRIIDKGNLPEYLEPESATADSEPEVEETVEEQAETDTTEEVVPE